MLNIAILNKAKVSNSDIEQIQSMTEIINKVICEYFSLTKNAIIDFSLIDSNEIKKINLRYRNKNKITDVISVCLWKDNVIVSKLLGEIFMNIQQIKLQANEYGYSWQREFIRMFIHSVLHLFDFNHEESEWEEYVVENIQDYLTEQVIMRVSNDKS